MPMPVSLDMSMAYVSVCYTGTHAYTNDYQHVCVLVYVCYTRLYTCLYARCPAMCPQELMTGNGLCGLDFRSFCRTRDTLR